MASDIKVIIEAVLNSDQFKKSQEKIRKSMTKTSKVTDTLKKAFKILAGSFIAKKIIDGFIKITKVAINAQETFSKFNQVFKDVQAEAENVAKSFQKNFGLSSVAAKELLSDTGDLLSGFGFTGKAALDLSKEVNELAVDLASFTNFSGGAKGASAALTKALLGERESVKSLGIAILEADVQAKVLQLRQEGLTFQTERQAKAYATLRIAQEQSKNAIGDFSRTSEQTANVVRIFNSRIQDLIVSFGSKLLPVITPTLKVISDLLVQEGDLSDVTKELVKASTEYAKITDTLANASENITDKERQKLQIRRAELRLDIVKSLRTANKLYKEQVTIIPDLKNKIKDYKERIDETINTIERINKGEEERFSNAVDMTGATDKLTSAIDSSINMMEFQAKAQIELEKRTGAYNEAVNTLADGLKRGDITRRALIGLDEELVELAIKRAETIKIVNKAEVEAHAVSKLNLKEKKELNQLVNQILSQEQDEYLEKQLAINAKLLENTSLTAEERIRIAKNIADIQEELDKSAFEKWKEKNKEKIDLAKTIGKMGLDVLKTFLDTEIQLIEKKVKTGTMTEKQGEVEIAKIRRKQAIIKKTEAIVDTTVNAAVAVIKAYATLGPIGGSIAANFIAGLAAFKIAQIKKQPLPEIPSFQKGTEKTGEGLAMLHANERIIPSNLNIPDIDNETLMAAAIRGLNIGSNKTDNIVNNSTSTENTDNRTINITVQGNDDPIEFVNNLKKEYGLEVFT